MERLASPIEALAAHYDVVVVGSGYGGSIVASRLSRAGRRVCVLERGRERVEGEFPETLAHAAKEVQIELRGRRLGDRDALFDVRVGEDINVLVGCGLGGTSLINAGVALRPDRRVFETAFPRALREDLPRLDEAFARAEAMLGTTTCPSAESLHKFVALRRCAETLATAEPTMHVKFFAAPINVTFEDGVNAAGVAQRACIHCGNCITGCNHRAKNVLTMNYLPDAKRHGAELFTGVVVSHVTRDGDRWRVHAEDGVEVSADLVVIAAGVLGSTELLYRSRTHGLALSDRIGARFSGNGDVVGFAYDGREEVDGVARVHDDDPPCGPTITGVIDARGTEAMADGVVIEDSAIPSALSSIAPALLAAARALGGTNTAPGEWLQQEARELESLVHGAHRGATRNTQTFLVMSHDDGNGEVVYQNDRVSIVWPEVGAQARFETIDRDLMLASSALGAIYTRDPIWAKWLNRNLITVHPLGGCPMGDDSTSGVVDHVGQVFDGVTATSLHDGLFVCDGAILPTPLGVNPLLTISALAERACVYIARARGWSIDYSTNA